MTEEIQQQERSWIKRAQSQGAKTVKFARDQEQLNLQHRWCIEDAVRVSIRFTYQIRILSQRK